MAATCAALPDIDAIGWPLHISNDSLLAHRALTHSLTFALVGTVLATLVFFRGTGWSQGRARIAAIVGVAFLSHPCLDALSTYSLGVEFFAPFSQQRFRFPWTPLGSPHGSLVGQLVQEAGVVLLPALLIGWLGMRIRGGGPSRRELQRPN
jgi:inner membrane protein